MKQISMSTYRYGYRRVFNRAESETFASDLGKRMTDFQAQCGDKPEGLVVSRITYDDLGTASGTVTMPEFRIGEPDFHYMGLPVLVSNDLQDDEFCLMTFVADDLLKPDTKRAATWVDAVSDPAVDIREAMKKAMDQEFDNQIIHGTVSGAPSGITASIGGAIAGIAGNSITSAIGASTAAAAVTSSKVPTAQQVGEGQMAKEAAQIMLNDAIATLKQTINTADLSPIEKVALEALMQRWKDERKIRRDLGDLNPVHVHVKPGDLQAVQIARDEAQEAVRKARDAAPKVTAPLIDPSKITVLGGTSVQPHYTIDKHGVLHQTAGVPNVNSVNIMVEERVAMDIARPESFVHIQNVH